MLLKNYDIITLANNHNISGNYNLNAKSYNGTTGTNVSAFPSSSNTCFKTYNKTDNVPPASITGTTLCVGSGDTAVTYEDYTINFISGLTCISVTQQTDGVTEDNKFQDSVQVIFCNSNSSAVTIKEIGIFYSGVTGKQAGYSNYLIYREVLDTPIEVPVGANVVIKFSKSSTIYNNAPADYVATASVE